MWDEKHNSGLNQTGDVSGSALKLLLCDNFKNRCNMNNTTKGCESPLRVNIEDGELVIRVGINRLDGNDCHPDIPELKFDDTEQWAKDVSYEIEREEENGQTPLGDLLDKAMIMAIENGSTGMSVDSPTHIGECSVCENDCVPLRHTRNGQRCSSCT